MKKNVVPSFFSMERQKKKIRMVTKSNWGRVKSTNNEHEYNNKDKEWRNIRTKNNKSKSTSTKNCNRNHNGKRENIRVLMQSNLDEQEQRAIYGNRATSTNNCKNKDNIKGIRSKGLSERLMYQRVTFEVERQRDKVRG